MPIHTSAIQAFLTKWETSQTIAYIPCRRRNFTGRNDLTRCGEVIARAVREQFDMLPTTADLLLDLADGIGHGFAALEIEWTQENGLHIPSAFHHRPQSWFQVLREDRNKLRLRDGTVNGAELWPFGWIIHSHRSKSGWLPRIGLFRSIAWPYLIRSYALESAVMYTQIHGIPFRVGKYMPGCPEEDKVALRTALANLGRDASGIIPKDAEIREKWGYRDPKGEIVRWTDVGFSYNSGEAWIKDELGQLPEPAQVTSATNWKELGLTDLRHVPAVQRLPRPALLPVAESAEKAEQLLATALGFTTETFLTVPTPVGEKVILRDKLPHMVEKRQDARERYANYILPTLHTVDNAVLKAALVRLVAELRDTTPVMALVAKRAPCL